MIPLQFLFAAPLAVLAIWLAVRYPEPFRAPWLIAFVASLAMQLVLIGTRYGYGYDRIVSIQPLTAILIPPLAYLAFVNPAVSARLAVHAIPLAAVWMVVRFAPALIDTALAIVTLGYALALVVRGTRGNDTLSWAPLRLGRVLRIGLWATVATLLLSGLTDGVIAADFFMTGGANTQNIAAGASLTAVVVLPIGIWLYVRAVRQRIPPAQRDDDQAFLMRLRAELDRNELFRDPDLTLGRLARRMGVPARQISEAINRTAGQNVSQFVNDRRIQAACDALSTSDVSVTNVMLEVGFFTKSNFNREFRRVTGKSPTAWRAAEHHKNRQTD